jgi:hypothetical protein
MKTRTAAQPQTAVEHSEFLILPDGRILAHNLTPAVAKILSELNPADEAMSRRSRPATTLKNELPN